MKQLEVALFRKGKFCAKFVVVSVDGGVPDDWETRYLKKFMPIFKADGFRAEFGEHNHTSVIAEENAGVRK